MDTKISGDMNNYIIKCQTLCDKLIEKYHIYIKDDHPVIFDIGSNLGCFSYSLTKKIKNGNYHLFEPVQKYLNLSKEYLKNNDHIIYNNYGLGNKNDEKYIFLDTKESSDYSIKRKPLWCDLCNKRCKKHKREFNINYGWNTMIESKTNKYMSKKKINIITLNDYCFKNNITKIDFVKIDTEGFEAFIIEGFLDTLNSLKKKPFLLIELGWGINHPNWDYSKKIFNKLFDIGYKRLNLNYKRTTDILFEPIN